MFHKSVAARLFIPIIRKKFRHKRFPLWTTDQGFATISQSPSLLVTTRRNRFFHSTSKVNSIVSFNLSDIGEGIKEVVVKEWYVKEGDKISQFDKVCEVQSDKALVTITSRYDGIIKKLYYQVEDIALVGKPLVDIDVEDEAHSSDEEEEKKDSAIKENVIDVKKISQELENKSQLTDNQDTKDTIFAIPSVRRLAREHKINLADIKGTGKQGRILKEDILKFMEGSSKPKTVVEVESSYSKPIRGYARAMIKTMTEAMEVPHFVYNDEISVTNLIKLREKLKDHSSDIGVRITYLPFFIKATSNALSRYPVLNSRLDENLENIIYLNNHNIGVAMDTPSGLVVPVIKNVQNKSIVEISKELNRLQDLSKEARFTQEDLSDGTFTFSNIGAIGGTYASPIILPPQRAIIALGAFKKLPRFDASGAVIPEDIAYISGAADHRVVDGATMAKFCNFVKKQIEEPMLLFLNV